MSQPSNPSSTLEKVQQVQQPRRHHPEDQFRRNHFLDKLKDFDVFFRLILLCWNMLLTMGTFASFLGIISMSSFWLLALTVASWGLTLHFFFSRSTAP